MLHKRLTPFMAYSIAIDWKRIQTVMKVQNTFKLQLGSSSKS